MSYHSPFLLSSIYDIMKIKGILKEQKVILDPHGHYEIKSFDDTRYDFHLHKETKRVIEGEKRTVIIKIPLNSNRRVTIKSNKKEQEYIPMKLEKEIRDILDTDITARNKFLEDIIYALKDYPKDFREIGNVKKCIERIGNAFGFDWKNLEIKYYLSGIRTNKYSAEFIDTDKRGYRIILDERHAIVEDMMKNSM